MVNGLRPTAITWRFSRHRHCLHQAFRAGVTVGKAFGVVDFSRFDEGVEVSRIIRVENPTLWGQYHQAQERVRFEVGGQPIEQVKLEAHASRVDTTINEVKTHSRAGPMWPTTRGLVWAPAPALLARLVVAAILRKRLLSASPRQDM